MKVEPKEKVDIFMVAIIIVAFISVTFVLIYILAMRNHKTVKQEILYVFNREEA
ncbi:MAG: hypothetical protein V1678_00960 [Candidatus Aenigmatarchaeota archaeon]